MNNSIFAKLPEIDGVINALTDEAETKWKSIQGDIAKFELAFEDFNNNYQDCQLEKALEHCTNEALDFIQYQQALIKNQAQLLNLQEQIAEFLILRFSHLAGIGEIERKMLEVSAELEKKLAAHSAKKEQRTLTGQRAVAAKLAKDPKQLEKIFIYECWNEWKSDTNRYRSKAAFARAMVDKCEHLTSQKKIEDWCRDWERKINVT